MENRLYQKVYEQWFASLPTYTHDMPARGTILAALVVLEHLKTRYCLDLDAHRAPGKAQIQGLSPSAVKKILERHGENRPFLSEGGRTNRGGPGAVDSMLNALRPLKLDGLEQSDRIAILDVFQRYLVERVREYHGLKRLEVAYDPSQATWIAIREVLYQASEVGKGGPVAQYLVGAKLQLRFPDMRIPNDRYSAGDTQTGRSGDFQVCDTAFHVTVAPAMGVFEKCTQNLKAGLRVYLLVPDDKVAGARQIAEQTCPSRIAVESLESFIGNNIEELSGFCKGKVAGGMRRLLELYNERVGAIETDKSLLIEIPRTLA